MGETLKVIRIQQLVKQSGQQDICQNRYIKTIVSFGQWHTVWDWR